MLLTALLWLVLPASLWGVLTFSTPHVPGWAAAPLPSCVPQPPSQWMNDQSEPLVEGRAVLATNGMVVLQVCRPGVLTFTASGTAAQKLWPLMSVSGNDQPLLTARVSTERSYRVQVPEAGFLTITFHDDAYLPDANPPEDRNLFVSAVRFVAVP